MSIRGILTKFGCYHPPALDQEEKKEVAQGVYHPRELKFSLSKPVSEKIAQELLHAMNQLVEEKNPKPYGLSFAEKATYPILFSYKIDVRAYGKVAVAHAQGMRPSMEDEHIYASGNIGNQSYELFGIIDGHGGDKTAHDVRFYIQEEIEKALLKQGLTDENIWIALKEAFVQLDTRCKERSEGSGAVAVISLKIGSDLWTANLGDCRAILKAKDEVIRLSVDAKPGDPRFKGSIEKRGGKVSADFFEENVDRINGMLSCARAFGDSQMKGDEGYYLASPRPKITKIDLAAFADMPVHLILACDGIWDVATSQDVSSIIDENSPPEEIAKAVVRGALNAPSFDNCSTLIARLN